MGATIEYRAAAGRAGLDPRNAVYHAVPRGEPAAVCGAAPPRGWLDARGEAATCAACRRKLGMGPLPAPRAGAAPATAAEALADAARRRMAARGGTARENVLGLIEDLADGLAGDDGA